MINRFNFMILIGLDAFLILSIIMCKHSSRVEEC